MTSHILCNEPSVERLERETRKIHRDNGVFGLLVLLYSGRRQGFSKCLYWSLFMNVLLAILNNNSSLHWEIVMPAQNPNVCLTQTLSNRNSRAKFCPWRRLKLASVSECFPWQSRDRTAKQFLKIYVLAFLFLYKFTDGCHRVETQLQQINVISYRYITNLFCKIMLQISIDTLASIVNWKFYKFCISNYCQYVLLHVIYLYFKRLW